MSKSTEAAAMANQPVGKAALCRLLGWARPTLDLRLAADPAFPVLRSGSKGGGWQFDPDAVQAYLKGAGAGHTAQISAESTTGAEASVTTRTAGEQTARQRRDAVQAEILEDQLRRNRGELVQVELMRQVLSTMLAHLGKGLDRLSDQIVEKLGLPEEYATDIRAVTDELRRTMADELKVLMQPPQ